MFLSDTKWLIPIDSGWSILPDPNTRENNYDLLYKNECQNWRNKINKAKKTAGFPAERLEEMITAYDALKKEALQKKKAVRERTASPKEFMDWLYQQSNIIIGMTIETF